MQALARMVGLTAPLFVWVLLGYVLSRWGCWPKAIADALTHFVFSVAIPALLFRLMSDFSKLPSVDARLLIAYFGACFAVFLLGRFVAARFFRIALNRLGLSNHAPVSFRLRKANAGLQRRGPIVPI